MRRSEINRKIWVLVGWMVASLAVPAVSSAQGGAGAGGTDNTLTRGNSVQTDQDIAESYLRQTLGDPREEAAYQAFHKTREQDADKKIKLGNTFLAKYPADRYSQAVYEELTQTYYDQKDLANFYSYSDKGLGLFPDSVPLLALSGWVIPRAFTPNEPDADKRLDKAETQERHALDVLSKMGKPTNLSDEQFAQFKTGESAVAHSGLGLIYFRREKYEESAKELQMAIPAEVSPDQTDLFVLGADFENLGQFKQAADAFHRCAQTAGVMQDKCSRYASDATKRAAEAK